MPPPRVGAGSIYNPPPTQAVGQAGYSPPPRVGGDPTQAYMYEEKQRAKMRAKMLKIIMVVGGIAALFLGYKFLFKKKKRR